MKNYCLCDRTLVEGISKVPWMSIIEDSKLKIMIRNAFLYPKLPKLRHFKKLIGR